MKLLMTSLVACFAAFAAAEESGYRQNAVHGLPLDGVVTFSRSGDRYFFMVADDGSGSWRIERESETAEYPAGTRVSVTGGVSKASFTTRRMNNAQVAVKNGLGLLPRPKDVTVADLYRHPLDDPGAEDLWATVVRCEGVVRDINRRQTFTQIQLGDGERSFQAAVRIDIGTPLPPDLKLGAKVAVVGVMLYSPVDDPVRHVMTDFTDISVMPHDIYGVEILSKAPFWTVGKVGMVLLVCAVVLALVAAQLRLTMREKRLDKLEFEAIRRERLKLSYELHDDFQQLLGSCQFRLEAGTELLGRDDAKAREHIEKVQRWLIYTQELLRKRLWGMNENLAAMERPTKEEKS